MEIEVKWRFDTVEEFHKVFSVFNLPITPLHTAVAVSEVSEINPEHAICECCGEDFIPETNRKKKQLYCSKKCYMKQYWKTRTKDKNGKTILKEQEKEVKKKS
jgi:hypothetical protein